MNTRQHQIHATFRTSAFGLVMLAFIIFHGAVFGSNNMDPSSLYNPIDKITRDKIVLSLSKKNCLDAEMVLLSSTALSRLHRRLRDAADMVMVLLI